VVAAVVVWLVLTRPLGVPKTGPAGSILVFLPGTQDIRDVEALLRFVRKYPH
jgi:HrpA-like RNA helicase